MRLRRTAPAVKPAGQSLGRAHAATIDSLAFETCFELWVCFGAYLEPRDVICAPLALLYRPNAPKTSLMLAACKTLGSQSKAKVQF